MQKKLQTLRILSMRRSCTKRHCASARVGLLDGTNLAFPSTSENDLPKLGMHIGGVLNLIQIMGHPGPSSDYANTSLRTTSMPSATSFRPRASDTEAITICKS